MRKALFDNSWQCNTCWELKVMAYVVLRTMQKSVTEKWWEIHR